MRKHLTAAVVVALVLVAGSAADAAPMEQYNFEIDTVTHFDDFCGLAVRREVHDRGRFSLRLSGTDLLPHFSSVHHGSASWTNLATGRAMTAEWNYSNKDILVTDNGDGTITVLYQVPGPERFFGPDGEQLNLVVGMMRIALLIDHAGTLQDPADDIVLSETFVSDHGYPPQPPFDFCESLRTVTA